MPGFLRLFIGLWIALSLCGNLAQADELNDLAAQAMEISGTRETLEGVGKSIDLQMASDPRVKKMNKKQRAELTALLKDTLDGRRMARELTAALAATNDAARLRESVAAMRDPVFLKVTSQVVSESIKVTDDMVVAYAKGLKKRPPDPERIRLIQRLDAATDGSKIIADMRYEVAAQLFGGMQIPDREAKLAQLRGQIESAAPEEFAIRNLHAARNVSTQDLESYVRVHENEAMGWLARQIGYGIQKVMLDSLGRMMGAIMEVAAKKH